MLKMRKTTPKLSATEQEMLDKLKAAETFAAFERVSKSAPIRFTRILTKLGIRGKAKAAFKKLNNDNIGEIENQCYAFELPLKSILTDPKRFQNRTDAFSQASADSVAKHYDKNKFDPIVVWQDTKNGKIYVLSGHSRYEGMKQRGESEIPVRFFKGTEAEAIQFARVDANRSANAESIIEDLKAYKLMRDGDSTRGIKKSSKAELMRVFKGKHNKLDAWSYLNPNGKFIYVLSQENRSEYPFIEIRSLWVGQLRDEYKDQFSDIHENDVFNFLYSDEKNLKLPKEDFEKIIRTRIGWGKERIFPECNETGCEKIKDLAEVGPHRELYKRLNTLNEQKDKFNERLRTSNEVHKVYTSAEREVILRLMGEKEKEIVQLKKDLNVVEKEPGLFGFYPNPKFVYYNNKLLKGFTEQEQSKPTH